MAVPPQRTFSWPQEFFVQRVKVLPRRKRCKLLARVENEHIASRLMVKGQKNDFRDAEAIPR
jgi:hypothetical protein